jgi:hypothetical protein
MNNKAFTLLEVILAMVLLLSTITAITRMRFNATLRIWKGREESERIFLIRKVFQNVYMKVSILKNQGSAGADDVTLTLSDEEQLTRRRFLTQITSNPMVKTIEDPEVKISSQLFSISRKSELKDFAHRVKVLRSDGDWKSDEGQHTLGFLGFVPYFDEEEQ